MKIAIVSTGLWHVRRGIETWAATLAQALFEEAGRSKEQRAGSRAQGAEGLPAPEGLPCVAKRLCRTRWMAGMGQGEDVEEYGSLLRQGGYEGQGMGVRGYGREGARDLEVVLFCGSEVTGYKDQVTYKTQILPCWYRGTIRNKFWTAILARLGGWRYGFGSSYETEQSTFAPGLIRALEAGGFDIVHLQDPTLAWHLEKARRMGKHNTEVILAHGTEESVEFLSKFSHVQELSPYYRDRHKGKTRPEQTRHCISNFVDVSVFKPGDKLVSRKSLGLPDDAFVILSVGAVDHAHKRMRCLIDEFAMVERKDALLVIAGPCIGDAGISLISYASKLRGSRFRYFGDLNHSGMPDLYSAADLFVLCSLSEIFGIVFLEAMACGVPCIGHRYPVTEWIIGEKGEGRIGEEKRTDDRGQYSVISNSQQLTTDNSLCAGACIDMEKKGVLAEFLGKVTAEWITEHGKLARERAEKMFSKDVVVGQMMKMYEEVIGFQ